jgi:Zn-dependent protease
MKLGDDTAKRLGRLSLNPLSHLDFFGTVMLLFGPFGWAKPVPVNPVRLGNPKRDMIWVALAGPLSNILFGWLVAVLYLNFFHGHVSGYSQLFFVYLIMINIGLSFFNLLPLPPLDGSNIVRGFLSREKEIRFMHAMRFVPLIFIALLSIEWLFKFPAISFILDPIWSPYQKILLEFYGIGSLWGR